MGTSLREILSLDVYEQFLLKFCRSGYSVSERPGTVRTSASEAKKIEKIKFSNQARLQATAFPQPPVSWSLADSLLNCSVRCGELLPAHHQVSSSHNGRLWDLFTADDGKGWSVRRRTDGTACGLGELHPHLLLRMHRKVGCYKPNVSFV